MMTKIGDNSGSVDAGGLFAFIDKMKTCLSYDPSNGYFTWLSITSNRVFVGKKAGNLNNGYVEISIEGKSYRAHRLAWLMVHGKWPSSFIDHINGIRSDNRISNLREATFSENARNVKVHCDNMSGHKGVIFHEARNKPWQARIYINKKRRSLGYYIEAKDAHDAYVKASINAFGLFARAS